LDRVPQTAALYRPLVLHGTTAYVSGALPFDGPGQLRWRGKVGCELSLEEGKEAARLCAANLLRVLRQELGALTRIHRVLRLGGYVNTAPDFTDQHLDRKSTRLNSSHVKISYAVFCLKKKKKQDIRLINL